MKKGLGFLFLVLLIGTAAVMYTGGYCSNGSVSGIVSIHSRKLQGDILSSDKGDVHLEDYRPIDPVPSSKASIRHGPIQHGTPLMPFIPRSSPPPSQPGIPRPSPTPSQPKHVGFP